MAFGAARFGGVWDERGSGALISAALPCPYCGYVQPIT